ncbi:MAG TPA: DUF1353 domain-containing protein [Acidimicrobiales bacterium]|nr:DUF1353 domain-containing protein [Acidimicrobiales bacterium]
MSDFLRAKVVVEQVGDENWLLRKAFEYTGKFETFHVPVGQGTDFASVPRVFVWFLPRYGRYTKAAILHDFLWRERAAKGTLDYIDADGTFRRAMRELGVPFLRRWILWGAVRWGALVKPEGRKGWLREAPRVLLVSAVALPIVVPPAVVVGAALVVFHMVELVIWVPLKIVERVKAATTPETPKQANLPDLSWRL